MAELKTRSIELRADQQSADVIPCVISSEAPVDRGDYIEVLSHEASDIDTSRAPLPLVVQHKTDMLNVGVIEDLSIQDGKLRGSARFGSSELARQILADVKAGIIRSLSVGYQLTQVLAHSGRVKKFAWAPYEVSVVGVPADAAAGFYRSYSKGHIQMENIQQNQDDNNQQSRSQRRAESRAVEAERERVREITAMGSQFARFGAQEISTRALQEDWSVEETRSAIMERMNKGSINPLENGNFGEFANGIGMDKRDIAKYSIMRAIRALTDPSARSEAGFEIECSKAVEKQLGRHSRGLFIPAEVLLNKRDMTVGSASAGGNTVATNVLAGSFIDILRNRSEVLNMGATTLTGLVGNVAIPRKTGSSNAYWVSEGGSATESALAFDQVTMSPKSITGYVDISRKLMLQSSLDIEGLVRADLATQLATAIDLAAINGSGTNPEPRGILNTNGIGSVVGGTNGAAPTWDHIVDLESAVAIANADIGSLGFMTNAKVRGKLLKTEKSTATGQYVWADGANPLRGYRAAVSNQVPSNLTKGTASEVCSAIIFGNFADLLIGLWGGLDMMVDPYTLGKEGATRVIAFQDIDIAIRHPESFAVMKDVLTA